MVTQLRKHSKQQQKPDFITAYQDDLTQAYMQILAEEKPDIHTLIEEKHSIQNLPTIEERQQAYIDLWERISGEQQLEMAQELAKLSQLALQARINGNTSIVRAHNERTPSTADSMKFVMQTLANDGASSEQVQQFLDENAVAWFSLTGHPTEPKTVDFVEKGAELNRILSNPDASADMLEDILRDICHTPAVDGKKTPLEEDRETLITLDIIYDTALEHRKLVRDALDHEYISDAGNTVSYNDVTINTPLIRPCSWTLGDGDGNPNMTEDILRDGIAVRRQYIKEKHLQHFQRIDEALEDTPALAQSTIDAINDIRSQIENIDNGTQIEHTPEEVSQRLKELACDVRSVSEHEDAYALVEALQDMAYLIDCFGFSMGKIDMRHNAKDMMASVARMLEVATQDTEAPITAQSFIDASPDEQQRIIESTLQDDVLLHTISSLSTEELLGETPDKTCKTAARIIGRMQVMGENPDVSEKVVVAETEHPSHALATMLLMRSTGYTHADIFPLFESVADLGTVGDTMASLYENDLYRAKIVESGSVNVMIAKSDTARQDGRAEAEQAQFDAVQSLHLSLMEAQARYPEMEDVRLSVKNGGGHALQRGGGRVTEVPLLHGIAASRAQATDIGPSTLTIQGHQKQILFAPGDTCLGTLESLTGQNMYTRAGIDGIIKPPAPSGADKTIAQEDARIFAQAGGEGFDALARKPIIDGHPVTTALDALLVNAPWCSMKIGNSSSRVASRGGVALGAGATPHDFKGDHPEALSGRAISGERLVAHAGLPIFSVLGMKEAMQAVQAQHEDGQIEGHGSALHHLYQGSKLIRDSARATINAIAMADFDLAWHMLAEQERPSSERVKELATQFDASLGAQGNSVDVTMAYMEEYFNETERLTYEMITGQEPPLDMQPKEGIKHLWPKLHEQLDYREKDTEFGRTIEGLLTNQLNQQPDMPIDEESYTTLKAIYAGTDVINAPVGIQSTRTRKEPSTEHNKPISFVDEHIEKKLDVPSSISAFIAAEKNHNVANGYGRF